MFVCKNQLAASTCYLQSVTSVNVSTIFPEILNENLKTFVLSVRKGVLIPAIFSVF